MADVTVVQGDTAPDMMAVIHEEGDPKKPINLSTATVAFQMRKADDRRYTVNARATIEDGPTGRIRYAWGPNDLAIPGEYQAQFEVTYLDEKIQTTKTPFTIEVRRQ